MNKEDSKCPVGAVDCKIHRTNTTCHTCGHSRGKPFIEMYERTMREEKWVTNEDLFSKEPASVTAFKLLYGEAWQQFVDEVKGNLSLPFFNSERADFHFAESWEHLCRGELGEPFSWEWEIPQDLSEAAQDICRTIRNNMRAEGEECCGGCRAFYSAANIKEGASADVALIVCHGGGCLAPYFNLIYERYADYDAIDELLTLRGYWRETVTPAVTFIHRT